MKTYSIQFDLRSFFYFILLIFEGFPNRVLVYPDRGGLGTLLAHVGFLQIYFTSKHILCCYDVVRFIT